MANQNPTQRFDFQGGEPDRKLIRNRFNDCARNMPQYLVSDTISIPVATQTNNLSTGTQVPAGAVITGLSVIFDNGVDVTTGGTFVVGFGTESGDVSLVASTQINNTATDIATGIVVASNHGGIPHASGASIQFAAGAVLLMAAATTPFIQVIVGGAVLQAIAEIRTVIEYIPLGNFQADLSA